MSETLEARKAAIESRMEEITQAVRARMAEVGPTMLSLLPSEFNWMTPEEREEWHRLRLALPSYAEEAPALTNWTFSDDHPGIYTDEAWTASEEVAPGVWYERKHACLGQTRNWFTVIGQPPQPNTPC